MDADVELVASWLEVMIGGAAELTMEEKELVASKKQEEEL